MQVLEAERSAFVHGASPHCEPVKERRTAQIEELTEKLLVKIHRRLAVAAGGEFPAWSEHKTGTPDPQHRLGSHIEDRVIGVVLQDQGLAGDGGSAANITLANVSADR